MCDEEFKVGDLGGGSYGALEGDLGEKLRPLAGFGRPLESLEEEEEIWDGVTFTPEFSTKRGAIVYSFPTWNPLV